MVAGLPAVAGAMASRDGSSTAGPARSASQAVAETALSGLLKCSLCGGSYVTHDTARYECSSTAKGGCLGKCKPWASS